MTSANTNERAARSESRSGQIEPGVRFRWRTRHVFVRVPHLVALAHRREDQACRAKPSDSMNGHADRFGHVGVGEARCQNYLGGRSLSASGTVLCLSVEARRCPFCPEQQRADLREHRELVFTLILSAARRRARISFGETAGSRSCRPTSTSRNRDSSHRPHLRDGRRDQRTRRSSPWPNA